MNDLYTSDRENVDLERRQASISGSLMDKYVIDIDRRPACCPHIIILADELMHHRRSGFLSEF